MERSKIWALINTVSSRAKGVGEEERERVYARVDSVLEGCGWVFRMSPTSSRGILTLSSWLSGTGIGLLLTEEEVRSITVVVKGRIALCDM